VLRIATIESQEKAVCVLDDSRRSIDADMNLERADVRVWFLTSCNQRPEDEDQTHAWPKHC